MPVDPSIRQIRYRRGVEEILPVPPPVITNTIPFTLNKLDASILDNSRGRCTIEPEILVNKC